MKNVPEEFKVRKTSMDSEDSSMVGSEDLARHSLMDKFSSSHN